MKTTVTLLMLLILSPLNTFAQDYTQFSLPEGAKARLGKGSMHEDMVYSQDGTRLVISSSIGVWLYDTVTSQEVALLAGDWINGFAFSPDGRTLAILIAGNNIYLWDAKTGAHIRTLRGHTAGVRTVAFSPDGLTLASGGYDDTVRLWDAKTGAHIRTLRGHTKSVTTVLFSPDGRTIASAGQEPILRLWDAVTGAHKRTLTGPRLNFGSVAFSPDGKTLASGGVYLTIYLWNLNGGPRRALRGHTNTVTSLMFSPDGRRLASGSFDDTIRLWDANTGRATHILRGHTAGVRSVAFSPDGRTLASQGDDQVVQLWDGNTGAHIRTFTRHTHFVLSVAFSPDGRRLASGGYDETVRLWDGNTGAHKRTLRGHTDPVESVSFSPDGLTLASASGDTTVRLWDAVTGAHIRTLRGHTDPVESVSFSPDGLTLASASRDETIRLWNTVTGAHKRTLTGQMYYLASVTFSPDGHTLASGSYSKIHLWDVNIGTPKRTLTGHTSWVSNVSFSPDGLTLASASYDSTILLWELRPSTPTHTTVSVSPSPVQSPAIGEQLTVSLTIADGAKVAGYQMTVAFDTTALRYVESANGDYLPAGAFFIPATVSGNKVSLAATSLSGESHGDGTLATLTFEVVAAKASTLTLSDVILSDNAGDGSRPQVEHGEVVEPKQVKGDINGDGVVNIQDLVLVARRFGQTGQNDADMNGDGVVNIQDLVLVAGAFGNAAAAPSLHAQTAGGLTAAEVAAWLTQAQGLDLTDATLQRGVIFLEQLLAVLTPKETVLLSNYPNPFNPETWIPYHLAHPADVTLTVYDAKGVLVRQLDLGHQPAGYYTDRTKAAYWDGRNERGESVASGVYFYQLRAAAYSQTRRMVIVK